MGICVFAAISPFRSILVRDVRWFYTGGRTAEGGLSAAGRHLALHLAEVESAEGSFGTYLLSEDITAEPVMFGDAGRGSLVLGPGLGVSVDDQTLERLATEIIRMEG